MIFSAPINTQWEFYTEREQKVLFGWHPNGYAICIKAAICKFVSGPKKKIKYIYKYIHIRYGLQFYKLRLSPLLKSCS